MNLKKKFTSIYDCIIKGNNNDLIWYLIDNKENISPSELKRQRDFACLQGDTTRFSILNREWNCFFFDLF